MTETVGVLLVPAAPQTISEAPVGCRKAACMINQLQRPQLVQASSHCSSVRPTVSQRAPIQYLSSSGRPSPPALATPARTRDVDGAFGRWSPVRVIHSVRCCPRRLSHANDRARQRGSQKIFIRQPLSASENGHSSR